MCELTVYVIGKASGQWQAISEVFGDLRIICKFSTVLGGVSAPNVHVVQKSTVYAKQVKSR